MGKIMAAARMGQQRLEISKCRQRLREGPGLVDLLKQSEPAGAPALSALLGLTEDKRPLLLRLAAPRLGHILIAAEDNRSRIDLLRALVLSLALRNPQRRLQAAVLDRKGELASLENLPHLLTPVVKESEAALELLAYLADLCDQRGDLVREPHIVVLVNELTEWGSEVLSLLWRLQTQGPRVGIHLILSTSRPSEVDWAMVDSARFAKLLGAMTNATQIGLEKDELAALEPDTYIAETTGDQVVFQATCIEERRARELVQTMWEKPYQRWLDEGHLGGRLLQVIK